MRAQAFPVESKAFPSLSSKGAYHPRLVYSQADLGEIVSHATERGIRVVPEFVTPQDPRVCCAFRAWHEPSKAAVDAAVCGCLWVLWLKGCRPQDMPGHSSFGKGLPHLTIAACGGVLDPTQDATYEMLAKFLAEMAIPNALVCFG